MKQKKSILSFIATAIAIFGFISCEKENMEISASITDFSTEILQGDSASVSITINGGTPPFAFRYKYFDGEKTLFKNIIDIPGRSYTFKTLPTEDVTYIAESVASYGLIGGASGSADIKVFPVTYKYSESIPTSKAAFMQMSTDELTYTSLLQLRSSNNKYERRVFFEFDISQFTKIIDKSRYNLKFWLVESHSLGVDKESTMDVKAILGPLNEAMTWDTQPATVDLTPLFTQNFISTSTTDQIEFEGNINSIIYPAIDNNVNKITIVVRELFNNVGNGGYWFIGSDTYTDESKRPVIDMLLREKLN